MSGGKTKLVTMQPNIPTWKMIYILRYHDFILDSNPLECYCDTATLLHFVNNLEETKSITGKEHAFSNRKCVDPTDVSGELLLQLNVTELYCQVQNLTCPDQCKCYKRNEILTNIVDCRNASLTEMPSVLPPGKTELLFDENEITDFTLARMQCASVLKLQIQGNSLQTVDADCISDMRDLKVLYLSNSLLSSIPKVVEDMDSLEEIELGNNPYQCDCNSLWFTHWLINNKDIIQDHDEVKCVNFGEGTGQQIYNLPDEDFICKEASLNTLRNITVSTTCLAVLGMLCALLLYINWQRFKVFLYIHTGLHPFDKADDDDHMPYDVFVVYVSKDDWVKDNLLTPLTEEHGYKLFDCKKDFKFGADLDDNIEDGIVKSKRLLIVLTVDSLSNRLMRQTIETGVEKCNKEKSNFIIPVFHTLSPSKCRDKCLKMYIKSGRFVTSQNHQFLRRVLYYMPKKRNMSGVVKYSPPEKNEECVKKVPNALDPKPNSYSGNSFSELQGAASSQTSRHTTGQDLTGSVIDERLGNRKGSVDSEHVRSGDPSSVVTMAPYNENDADYLSLTDLAVEKPASGGSVVFVWYADEDFGFMMERIVSPLEECGHTFILADKSFVVGASIQENIQNAIETSHRTIIILSQASVVDEWLLYTFRFAGERQMLDASYMTGLIVRGDMDDLYCDDEVKKHLLKDFAKHYQTEVTKL